MYRGQCSLTWAVRIRARNMYRQHPRFLQGEKRSAANASVSMLSNLPATRVALKLKTGPGNRGDRQSNRVARRSRTYLGHGRLQVPECEIDRFEKQRALKQKTSNKE